MSKENEGFGIGFPLAQRIDLDGILTDKGWTLPPDLTVDAWSAAGTTLGRLERAIQWWIGDWWIYGEHHYGERKAIVTAPDWTGPSFQTCMNAATVCRAFTTYRRREVLSFRHHAELAAVEPEMADGLLDDAVMSLETHGRAPSAKEFRLRAKRLRRGVREQAFGEGIEAESLALGSKRYGVILCDPPWRFEVYSRETGLDRSPDNHYVTMTIEDICNLVIPAAENAVLFLWVTPPMIYQAVRHVVDAWGFEYVTEFVWIKDRPGTGFWALAQHETLLVCKRGKIPAPAPGHQFESVFEDRDGLHIELPVGRHSEKPEEFALLVEELFPNTPKLEMFARKQRPGWSTWGYEAATPPDVVA